MPIDHALHSRQKVNNVVEIATKYNSKVHILGLVEGDEASDERKLEIKLESAEHVMKNANIQYIKSMVKGHNLAVEAMKYSEQVGADLIVIMTDHESHLTGMFLGTVAKQIVNHSKIPVLSIRPIESDVEEFDPSGGTGVL
jgi:nucleotide-binding universal stress UspA family protein